MGKTLAREKRLKDLGYNVVTMTSCQWLKTEESKIKYIIEENGMQEEQIIEQIKNDQIFGFLRCDVRVPEDKIEEFSEFPPVFKNTEITISDIGEHMQQYCLSVERKTGVKRSLIGSMFGKNILLLTPLVKEYIDMGLIVENIEEVVEYNGKSVFGWFMNEISDERRMADLNPDFEIRGLIAKLMGNSGYGRTVMNPYLHTNIRFVSEENIPGHVASPFFKNITELNDDVYEVEKKKKDGLYVTC